jgi:hypothetical protein
MLIITTPGGQKAATPLERGKLLLKYPQACLWYSVDTDVTIIHLKIHDISFKIRYISRIAPVKLETANTAGTVRKFGMNDKNRVCPVELAGSLDKGIIFPS